LCQGFLPDVDDFEVLGSLYGEAAKLVIVKCETIDLMVPANAEIVLECQLMATEGWVHDEARLSASSLECTAAGLSTMSAPS
jgi:hypothetical protein